MTLAVNDFVPMADLRIFASHLCLAIAHPANLFPPPPTGNESQIVDPAGDQFGTDSQDILSAKYAYDPVANQIVYTMTLKDMSTATANMHWIQEANLKDPKNPNATTTLLYVTTS